MENEATYFKLFAHNVPVSGKSRSAIYDLQKGEIVFIPTILFDILQALTNSTIAVVQDKFAPNNPAVFKQYLDFLLKKDLGFITESPTDFPALSLQWESPCEIYSAVIEADFQHYSVAKVLTTLDELLCRHIELRLDIQALSAQEIIAFFEELNTKTFRSIVVLLDYQAVLWYDDWATKIFESCKKIEKIFVVGCPVKFKHEVYAENIKFLTKNWAELYVEKPRYIVNIQYFSEAQHHHPFYNRKVCIDNRGNIKNDIRQRKSFGNVRNHDTVKVALQEAINSADFRELWYVNPDKIAAVKDSELRYCQYLPFLLSQNKENDWVMIQDKKIEPIS